MKKKNVLAFCIGVIVLAYLVYREGPENIIRVLADVQIEYFLLAGFLYFLNEIAAAISLKIITPGRISLLDTLISHMCGMFYSNATPGRVGYYYTSFSIAKKTKTKRRENIGLLTLFQGINFLIKVFLCLLALLYFSTYIVEQSSQNYLFIVSILPIAGVVLLALVFYTDFFNKAMEKIPYIKRFTEQVEGMQKAVREVEKTTLLKLLGLAALGWILTSGQWFFIAKSMGLGIGYLEALMLQPLLSTVMFVPLSPAGLGFTEAGSAILFSIIKYSGQVGVAFMLLVRINAIAVDLFGIVDMKIHGG